MATASACSTRWSSALKVMVFMAINVTFNVKRVKGSAMVAFLWARQGRTDCLARLLCEELSARMPVLL